MQSNQEIEIVRPVRSDFEELRRLFTLTIQDTFKREGISEKFAHDIPDEIQFQLDALTRDFESDGRLEYFLVAKHHSRIVGTSAFGSVTNGVRKALAPIDDSTPEVKAVYILPEFQGRGIGSLLFKRIMASLKALGIEEFCLESGYKSAQRYWNRKLGEPAFVCHDYFEPGAHLMFWRNQIEERFLE